MPFGGGPGSARGSEVGHTLPIPSMGYQNPASVYGMITPQVQNSMVANMNMFGIGGGSQSAQSGGFNNLQPPSMPAAGLQFRPISTFSLATTVNPFASPSLDPNPTDDDLIAALRNYLSTQDLMTVTKKQVSVRRLHLCSTNMTLISRTTREAIMAKFPKADLASRKDFLNQSIEEILSES
jgi:chitin synthase